MEIPHLTLRQISERLNLPLDRLRYVVNQELMESNEWFVSETEVGQPLRFDFVTAVSIGCAAFLLEGGLKRESVRSIMRMVGEVTPSVNNPLRLASLTFAVTTSGRTIAQVADGCRVRWKFGRQDTGWIDPENPSTPDDDFNPKVVVAIDFGYVRDLLQKSPAEG